MGKKKRGLLLIGFTLLLILTLISNVVPAPAPVQPGPFIDERTFHWVLTYDTALSGFLDGAFDTLDVTDPGDLRMLEEAGYHIYYIPRMYNTWISINHRRQDLNNLWFRRAIAHTIPKEDIIAAYYAPIFEYTKSFMPYPYGKWSIESEEYCKSRNIPGTCPESWENIPDPFEFNPVLADQILTDHGYPWEGPGTWRCRTLDLAYIPEGPAFKEMMEMWAAELNAIGVPTRLVSCPGVNFYPYLSAGDWDFINTMWSGEALGISPNMDIIYSSDGIYNWCGGWFNSSEYDEQVDIATSTMDVDVALEATWRAQEIMNDQVACIPLLAWRDAVAVQPELIGFLETSSFTTLGPILLRWREGVNPNTGGNDFRYATTFTEAENFIPGWDRMGTAYDILGQCFDTLVNYHPWTNDFMSWIAYDFDQELWSAPDIGVTDGMKITLHIRDDVYFQDGYQLTAHDVRFSFLYYRNYEAPEVTLTWEDLVDVVCPDLFTVELYYNKTYLFQLYYVSYETAKILPMHIWNPGPVEVYGEPLGPMDLQEAGKPGVPDPATFDPTTPNPFDPSLTCLTGAGPYIFDSWDKAMHKVRLRANRNYFKTPLIGDLDFDFKVDMHDLNMVTDALGSKVGDPEYSPNIDVNGDGVIDDTDISLIEADLGKTWGWPWAFTFSNLAVSPADIKTDEEATVTVTVTNEGDDKGTYQAILKIDEHPEAYEDVTLEAGASTTVTFKVSKDEPGTYNIEVGGQTATLTVSGLTPAKFSVTSLSVSPLEVETGENATITVTVKNTGDLPGEYTVTLKVNGVTEDTQGVTLDARESTTVTFTVTKDATGTYNIEVDGQTATLTVITPPAPPYLLYAGIVVTIIIIAAAIIWRTRRFR